MQLWKYRVELKFLQDFRLGRANFVLIYGSLAKLLEAQDLDVHRVLPFSNLLGISPLQPSRAGSAGEIRWFYALATEDIESAIRELESIYVHPVKVLSITKRAFEPENELEKLSSLEPRIATGHFPVEVAAGKIIFPGVSDLVFPLFVFMHRFGILRKHKILYKSFKKILNKELISYKISFYHYERETRTYEYAIHELRFSQSALEFYPGLWRYLNMLNNILSAEP
jgi:hypothetical protein